MEFKHLLLGLMAAQLVVGIRFAMYVDQYHTTFLPKNDQTSDISHAIMAFAESTLFNSSSPRPYKPFEPVSTFKQRFGADTKVMVAIGGWGGSEGFSIGARDEKTRAQYAKNIASMIKTHGFDGVDIDWEYPGGNGADYKNDPNSDKKEEVHTFPLFLEAIRNAIGKDKVLSVAVPGKTTDMIAFTKETGPKIWKSVDFVNVMSYDLTNRRDNVTGHHSSVADSLKSVKQYLDIGLEASKINLGMSYYAKWFSTKPGSDCSSHPLGCELLPLENADGSDNHKSGAFTFEKGNLAAPPANLPISYDGTCGFAKGAKCPPGSCCSADNYCGTSDEHCMSGCLSDYGTCKGISLIESWRRAEKGGITDQSAGGKYFWDEKDNLFWTWDSPEMMARKFTEVVDVEKVGGVMAWSLGEDTYEFAHVKAMQKGVASRK
ncbi:hypothetical protein ASPWEDRAFT_157635 [Aspergillus wentii DTO 134E9]|uniref:chitinase n=1 Tax=Aspergillus wentii DTO 134E9 TaxID=1073089 RepID=A0A1L9RGT0_ASPWE|nr:uncharacterized protein ASPWEDRAFT_157635 [Aspergillus wentii DTO 134E9]OJJ34114.1 hypothetical protein ASPWEDRAFT_157635 [Aspergillus wentii DTO 134E9]